MALDGPEIICGDFAADLVSEFNDKFNSGADLDELEYWADRTLERCALTDLDREIWASVCALCFWEVGLLSPEFLEVFDEIVADKAGIEFWKQHGLEDIRSRELNDLRIKISKPNPKPRNRRNYSKLSAMNQLFNADSVVSWQLKSGVYRASIIVSVEQYRGEYLYHFAPTTYSEKKPPSTENLTHLLGTKIGYGFPKEEALKEQPGIDRFWDDPFFDGFEHRVDVDLPTHLKSKYFTIGLIFDRVEHKNLESFNERFTQIGSIKIASGFKMAGSYSDFQDFDDFETRSQYIDDDIRMVDYLRIPIDWIIE